MKDAWFCLCCLPLLFVHVSAADATDCMSMVQRQALPLSPARHKYKSKPWEVNNYIFANYHKAGVFLSVELLLKITGILGAADEVVGQIEYPCYADRPPPFGPFCYNTEAPMRFFTDSLNASVLEAERRKSGSKRLLVAGLVRDPFMMVASAYCYHHTGQEIGNELFPVLEIMQKGLEQGTALVAEHFLPIAEWMASIYDHPDPDILRLEFDDITESSNGFDLAVQRLLDHFFGTGTELISEQDRFRMIEAARALDMNRHGNASYVTQGLITRRHNTDTTCKKAARAALDTSLDSALLEKYKDLQRRLGYRLSSA